MFFDQSLKWASYSFLEVQESITIFTFLNIELSWELVFNQGMAWGIGQGFPALLLIIRTALLTFLLLLPFLLRGTWLQETAFKQLEPILEQGAWVLMITGGVSNLLDLAFYGSVVDMISFTFWSWPYPVFNLADTYICLAAIWLILASVSQSKLPLLFKKD